MLTLLSNNAILSVVTFHSLEDRIVKNIFKFYSKEWAGEGQPGSEAKGQYRYLPVVADYNKPILELINKKPITATEEEVRINPPSRSAKLRIARRINK